MIIDKLCVLYSIVSSWSLGWTHNAVPKMSSGVTSVSLHQWRATVTPVNQDSVTTVSPGGAVQTPPNLTKWCRTQKAESFGIHRAHYTQTNTVSFTVRTVTLLSVPNASPVVHIEGMNLQTFCKRETTLGNRQAFPK